MSGTGRAAQIGRPVAGKTGTTQSNRDGWFVGFSSGLTTGVWMGRDDARAISGLQGGTAPAGAFRDFMVKAVAKRPAEPFQTDVPMPSWQLEPGEESFISDEELPLDPLVDADGNPIGTPVEDPLAPTAPFGDRPQPQVPPQQRATPDQTELDRIFGGTPPPPERPTLVPVPRPVPTSPARPQRAPSSVTADGAQRRPEPTQF
jgi:penicillin-binding protein 1A